MRKTLLVALGMSVVLAFSGCSGKGKNNSSIEVAEDIDIYDFANMLVNDVKYNTELVEVEYQFISNYFAIDGSMDAVMYASNIACEELAVFKTNDEEESNAVKDSIQVYLDDQKAAFAAYSAEDVARVEGAVVKVAGQYVAFCVTDDVDTAKTIIDDVMSGKKVPPHVEQKTTVEESSDADSTDDVKDDTSDNSSENESSGGTSDERTTDKSDNKDDSKDDTTKKDKNDKEEETTKKKTGTGETLITGQSSNGKYKTLKSNGRVQVYSSVTVVDDAAFSFYGYAPEAMSAYKAGLENLATKLDGVATIYNIPANIASMITFPDDQSSYNKIMVNGKPLNSIQNISSDKYVTIDMYDTLMKHRDEYIFFRTDHHWTATGAYYAYTLFCDAKGIKAEELSSYKTMKFDNFKGSYVKETGDEKLAANPDTVIAYLPNAKSTSLHAISTDGREYDWQVITDVSSYGPEGKYSTFCASDNSIAIIKNNDLSDGSACIVVKDSFGNAFIPFLVDHYQTIYEVDFRYWNGSLVNLAKESKATDVLFVVHTGNTGNTYATGKIASICK